MDGFAKRWLKVTAYAASLDKRHSVFGVITSGLDVVQKIGKTQVDRSDRPLTPVVMNKVTIERV